MDVMETSMDRMESTDTKASSTGVWLFRILVLAAAGVMLVSWLLPWWNVDIEMFGNDMVQIRPWGLVMDERLGDFTVLMKGAEMPVWFAPFMWTYFGLCMLALLVGAFIREREIAIGGFKIKLNQLLIGGVGISYFVVGIVTAIFASIRCRQCMGIPLLGRSFVDLGDPLVTFVESRFLPGYYLIYVAALLLIALAFLRSRICES
jgi:hypothetical protein